MEAIIVASISALASIIVVILQIIGNKKSEKRYAKASDERKEMAAEQKMFSAKQAILQMMMEDMISVELVKKPPCNHSRIHYEYDIYKANGGNSDIDDKMKEYTEWYNKITARRS